MRRVALACATSVIAACVIVAVSAQKGAKKPLAAADIDDIATLLMLEDARKYDEAELKRLTASAHQEVRRRAVQSIGRIADRQGLALLDGPRKDADVEVAATATWAAGQLRDAAAIGWLSESLASPRAAVAREAAIALGKIQGPPSEPGGRAGRSPDARAALAGFLLKTPITKAPSAAVGEALLSIGRFPAGGDLAPILRWTTSTDVETRWRAAWALFRSRAPEALPELLRLSRDPSAEVRSWAVRGLIAHPNVDPAPAAARLRELVATEKDRAVRTEALRTLGAHDDEASVKAVIAALDAKDAWFSVSAAEVLARQQTRADLVVPPLAKAAAMDRPAALRTTARQSLARIGPAGRAVLDALATPGTTPPPPPGSRGPRPQPQLKTLAEYRQLVERWIVPDYNGAAKPRAIWETPRGTIELELYPGDAPLGTDYFVKATTSGDIVGTEFTRVVPHFVAQQRTITNAPLLRDEVSRRGLTRGNLSWASAGLDTGRPGYTLGVTPQPHNEGNFTALGRIVRGMDVLERIELGDAVTAARMVR